MTQALVEAPVEQATVVPLPQLLEREDYTPNTLPFIPRNQLEKSGQPTYPALEDWIQIFRQSIASFRRTAEADSSLPEAERLAAAERFASAYLAIVNEVEQDALAAGAAAVDGSSRGQQPGCLELCQLREEALRAAGFTDIFRQIKAKENSSALGLLRDVCAELDQHSEQRDRWGAVIRGVFAGNIFDLGCAATTDMYHQEGISFHATRDKLLPRPWVIDDLDTLLDRLCRCAAGQASAPGCLTASCGSRWS